MQLSDPFPVEALSPRVREIILSEFGGRHPSVVEVLRVPDDEWLKLPAIGPATVELLRSLAPDLSEHVPSSPVPTKVQLRAHYYWLKDQQTRLHNELKRIQVDLRATRIKLRDEESPS
jgi:hypothetical protein